MIKGIIFDMDGVLLDSMPLWNRAPALYIESLGKTPEENLGTVMFSMTMEEGCRYLIDTYGLDLTVPEIMQGIVDNMLCRYEQDIPLKEGAEELLCFLKEKDLPVTVATTSKKVMAEAAFARLGISKYIDHIFTSDDVGCGKEQPDLFLMAAGFMKTKPQETLIFEDALHAVLTARKAGFKTVGIYDAASEAKQTELKKFCDIYVMSPKEAAHRGHHLVSL